MPSADQEGRAAVELHRLDPVSERRQVERTRGGARRARRGRAAQQRSPPCASRARGTRTCCRRCARRSRALCTVGEICGVLREEWGVIRQQSPLVRILVVSQMYPGPRRSRPRRLRRPDRRCARGTRARDRARGARPPAGGKLRYLELRGKVRRRGRPDVVWAHFLVPSGLIASSVDAPLVVTAHGRDVRNIGAIPGVAALTRRVVRRACAVIAVSDYLRRELELRIPEARGKTTVIDSGVDLERFAPARAGPAARLASEPAFLAVGTLSERKNVVRLAERSRRLGRGSLDLRRRRAASRAARGRASV